MTDELTKRRGAVVVTGASSGIGEACALRLDRRGFQVFAGVRRKADGNALRAQASSALVPLTIDVTDDDSIASAVSEVSNAVGEGGLRGLINNAGIAVPGPLEFLPLDDLRRQMNVNVIGQIAVTQAFLPLLRRRKGRIVNIGSIGGRMATPFIGAYSASKFAMEALTDSLRMELKPWGISVSIVEPGSISTPIWDKGLAAADDMGTRLSEQAHDYYDDAISAMKKASDKTGKQGIPADEVAKVVEHALLAKKPRTRYVVGRDAKIQAALAMVIPDRMRDWLIAQQMGLPKRA